MYTFKFLKLVSSCFMCWISLLHISSLPCYFCNYFSIFSIAVQQRIQSLSGFHQSFLFNFCAVRNGQSTHSTQFLFFQSLSLENMLKFKILFYIVNLYKVCLEKVQPLLTQQKGFAWHWCNLAAKESGWECTRVNNDDFTVLISGGGRGHWVSMGTMWSSHSKWLRESSNKYASNF